MKKVLISAALRCCKNHPTGKYHLKPRVQNHSWTESNGSNVSALWTRLLVWSCCADLLCSNWHIKAKTVMTGAEFQPDTHPLTEEIRLSHKCNLRACRHVLFFPPPPTTHADQLPLWSEICIHCPVRTRRVSWIPRHLLLHQAAHSNVSRHLWSVDSVHRLRPPPGATLKPRDL